MENSQNSNYSKLRLTLNFLFITLLGAQVMYLLVGLFIIQSGDFKEINGVNNIFMFIIPLIDTAIIFAIKFIYEKGLRDRDKKMSLDSKIKSYQINNIIKLALLEGANIMNTSAMIITANYFYAALFIIIAALFLLNRPTIEKFIMEYELSPEEVVKVLG